MPDLAYLLSGSLDEKITWRDHTTTGGHPVYGSRRSIAHLEATDQAARKEFGVGLAILQSAYNVGVAASAGTHDKDKVYDVYIPGVDWWTAQKFLRQQGWAAWFRYPPTFSAHIHMVSLGGNTPVGVYVPGQVADYYAHRDGLAGHAGDSSWHPADINKTIFDYAAWAAEQGDIVTPEDIDKIAGAAADKIMARLNRDLTPKTEDDLTLRQAIKDLHTRVEKLPRDIGKAVADAMSKSPRARP